MSGAPAAARPIAAAIAVVRRGNAVLLVRRRHAPDRGKWGFPGGRIEAGESVREAAVRELREETGVAGEAGVILDALDVIERDAAGAITRHFLLLAVQCEWVAGEPVAADDAAEAAWHPVEALGRGATPLSDGVVRLARAAQRAAPC